MTNWDSVVTPSQEPRPKLEAVKRKRRGRIIGSYNYGARSHLAREMKIKGIRWTDELIDAYKQYKAALAEHRAGNGLAPDPELLHFWMEIMPYLSVKMIETETRGVKPIPTQSKKGTVTMSAVEELAKAEGRQTP